MALVGGQISGTSLPVLSNTTAVPLVTVPTGTNATCISNTSNATVYIGAASAVPAAATLIANGFPLPTGATITLPGYRDSAATQLYVVAGVAVTSGAVGWFITTPK